MCMLCVEIIRQRITVKDAIEGLRGEYMGNGMIGGKDPEDRDHKIELLDASNSGDTDKLKKLIKAGYKKERWL